ncbi:MAG: hypothetical protein NNA22_05010 [Nitrospira sp.]|nr:hypothetical protein [Nitrospira sp.]
MRSLLRGSALGGIIFLCLALVPAVGRAQGEPASGDNLHIEITKKGIGKQVVITQGTKEWFLLVDVTPEHSVVVRQEKDGDHYLVDETETHDRPMTEGEVEAAVEDYINSVKVRLNRQ